mgnify:FL=1
MGHKKGTVKGKSPRKAEKEWMDKICQVGCIVCWKEMDVYSPAEPHHIVSGSLNPRGRKDHMLTIPLCPAHHRFNLNNDQCVSRHYYKAEFEKRYGTEAELLEQTKKMVEKLH